MKQQLKSYMISWGILLALFNIVVFLTPDTIFGLNKYTPLFWVAYATIILSFIIQLLCTQKVSKAQNIQKLFLNLPVLSAGIYALISTAVVGGICMLIPIIPTWLGIISCAIITGYYILTILQATEASSIIGNIDDKIKEKTLFIKSSALDMELILTKAENEVVKEKIFELTEIFKYSDPVSHPTLMSLEQKIEEDISKLDVLVSNNAVDDILLLTNQIKLNMEQRNKKCMLLK